MVFNIMLITKYIHLDVFMSIVNMNVKYIMLVHSLLNVYYILYNYFTIIHEM